MLGNSASSVLADQARQIVSEYLIDHVQGVLDKVVSEAQAQLEKLAERSVTQQRRDAVHDLRQHGAAFSPLLSEGLRERLHPTAALSSTSGALVSSLQGAKGLSLVDHDTIQREILGSRLSLAVTDQATWEFSDLRARLIHLDKVPELLAEDLIRVQTLARCFFQSWLGAGLNLDTWHVVEDALHLAVGTWVTDAMHEGNRWLVEKGVLPEIDLRAAVRKPANRRASTGPNDRAVAPGEAGFTRFAGGMGGDGRGGAGAVQGAPDRGAMTGFRQAMGHFGTEDETRLLTRQAAGDGGPVGSVMAQFGRLMERHLPGFGNTVRAQPPSAGLVNAVGRVQEGIVEKFADPTSESGGRSVSPSRLLSELRSRHQTLKQAASTPAERATIELVALLFHSILTEDRIPSAVRVWFARLQMPVLRVAIAEPDFFSSAEHPARQLIDRMGACVMGFDGASELVSATLEAEIKRVVQVVEAFPDTGRRVFGTVLAEFAKFLEGYFRVQNESTRKGVSLAQQVEQRETLAIQYTIELRKMLNEVPVQDGVREFLFQIWADVLATTAMRHGKQSEEVRAVRSTASDLMWIASAKVTREERAEVIRRLPPLLATLRQGMTAANVAVERQDESLRALNLSLTAAFGARAATISPQQLEQLKQRLETLEELLPDAEIEIDDEWVLDGSSRQTEGLEIVSEGGSMPSEAMLAWAAELQVGGWFMLDYHSRNEPMQLVWQGMHKHLALFVSEQGRGVLFQKHRLASFLQAGLLLPAQEESLTTAATRMALEKINADPERLLS
jgi:hypothetical protein